MECACDPTVERHFKGHRGRINGLSFHPSTTRIASSSADHSLIVWHFANTIRATKFTGHHSETLDVSYAPSGEAVATGSRDTTVRIWLPKMRKSESIKWRPHVAAVRCVRFSPDGEKLLTCSDDKSAKLTLVCRRRFLMSFAEHRNWVRAAKFSPDGRVIATCSDDKSVKIWDLTSGDCVRTIREIAARPVDVEFHPNGTAIGTAQSNGCARLYDLRTATLQQHYLIHADETQVNKVRFHPNGNFMLTASEDGYMKVLDLLEGRPIYSLKGHEGSVTAISFSESGDYFASGGDDRQLLIWKTNFDAVDANPGKCLPRLTVRTAQEPCFDSAVAGYREAKSAP